MKKWAPVLFVVSSLFLSKNVYADIIPPSPTEMISDVIKYGLLDPDVSFLAKIIIVLIPIIFIIIVILFFKYIIKKVRGINKNIEKLNN